MTDHANQPGSSVPSPCVRNCCLDEHDICLGCHRSITEIMIWNEASADEKREILARCKLRKSQRRGRSSRTPPSISA